LEYLTLTLKQKGGGMKITDWLQSQHWVVRMGIGSLILYGVFTIIQWVGLGVLQCLQMITFTLVVVVLVGMALGLLKDGAVDSFFSWVNSAWDLAKRAFSEAIDTAKEDLKAEKKKAS
jgi:hypothetical protein